jgi:enoyl-CoA hydratase
MLLTLNQNEESTVSVLDIEKRDHVTVVTLNRPDARNALSPELLGRLAVAWDDIKSDDAVRAVVLTGALGSTFCAGFDLALSITLLNKTRQPENEWDEALANDWTLAHKATLRGYDLERPLIVAANGHAIAGGMELLLAGDLRVVASGAKLGLSEVKLGLIPGMGGTATIRDKMSPALAAEVLLTSNPISAETALAGGLLNRVVPADAVLNTALELAYAVAANPPLAVRAARHVLRKSRDLSEDQSLALEAKLLEDLAQTEDAIEGPRAFLEKRPPVFKGR